MSDLHHILPDGFAAQRFSHLLPSLDRHRVTTSDILTLDAPDVAKRAQVPVQEVRKLQDAVLGALHGELGVADDEERADPTGWQAAGWHAISTLDERLDAELGGGIPTGYLTEITGESGAGKTQLLLTLLLSTQLPPKHGGLSKSALYISTEAPLATTRLDQLLRQHPRLSSLPASSKPSLLRILGIQAPDLEFQEHIVRFQLPVAIARHNVGLVVLDSVAANFRAEFERPEKDARAGGAAMAKRSAQLVQLGSLLRAVARDHDIAVVVANQVADRFTPPPSAPAPRSSAPSRTPSYNSQVGRGGADAAEAAAAVLSQGTCEQPLISPDPLTLDHQQRWFTGWGDMRASSSTTENLKTPSLGLVWTNQIAARIALLKQPVYNAPSLWVSSAADGREDWRGEGGGEDGSGGHEIKRWRRWMKVVFAPWAPPSEGKGAEFGILGSGLVARDVETTAEGQQRSQNAKTEETEKEEEEEEEEEEKDQASGAEEEKDQASGAEEGEKEKESVEQRKDVGAGEADIGN